MCFFSLGESSGHTAQKSARNFRGVAWRGDQVEERKRERERSQRKPFDFAMKAGKEGKAVWATCEGCDLLDVVSFKGDENRARPVVKGRFGLALPALFAGGRRGMGLASVANETAQQAAAKRTAELPLAQKISIGNPVTGKKIKTGPMMAPKNAKAEKYKVSSVGYFRVGRMDRNLLVCSLPLVWTTG